MNKIQQEKFLDYLSSYLTENKKNKIENISTFRTNYLTIVLEDITEPKDASAVIRSCECFGIQQINIIENNTRYRINPDVTMGSSKWVDIHHYKASNIPLSPFKVEAKKGDEGNTEVCLKDLKKQGYKIVAMSNHQNSISINNFPLENKLAFVFASEGNDLSLSVTANSDYIAKVPSYGFTGSFNLSVDAAMVIHTFINRLKGSNIEWRLNQDEILELKLKWVKKILKRSDLLEQKFLEIQKLS